MGRGECFKRQILGETQELIDTTPENYREQLDGDECL